MPHTGGGHGGGHGGFHTSSNGSVHQVPKFDNFGRPHSRHYIRPGFYYYGMYIPRHRRFRRASILKSIIFIIFVIIFGTLVITQTYNSNNNQDRVLEDFSLTRYSEVYNPIDTDYESNILVVISTYENENRYDYWPIVGDEVSQYVDSIFGNTNTVFGNALYKNLKDKEVSSSLLSSLADSLKAVNDYIEYTKNAAGTSKNQIINNTSFINNENYELLKNYSDEFYLKTGYSISFSIEDGATIKSTNIDLSLIFIGGIVGICLVAGIFSLVKLFVGMKVIDKSEKEGKEEKYFEGEDTYEKFKESDEYKLDPKDYDLTDEFK